MLPSLCDVVRAGVSGDHLLTATRKLLYENRFVIPGTRRLSNLMQAAVSSVEHDALSMIERSIPVLIRNRWLDALSGLADPEHRMTLLEYLQEPAAKFSPSTIERQSGKVSELLDLGVDCYKTDMLPALLQSYAQGMRKRRPSRFHQLQEPRRTLELVAFMRYALLEHTDNLIRLNTGNSGRPATFRKNPPTQLRIIRVLHFTESAQTKSYCSPLTILDSEPLRQNISI